MNKIVREHYPVEKLPEDLRALVPGAAEVTIEVTVEDGEDDDDADIVAPLTAEEAVAMMREMQRHVAARGESVTEKEAVRRVRELRDEWDD